MEFIIENLQKRWLAKQRYWKITPDEIEKFSYNESKLLNWEIKCVREPEDEARFIGIFLYKNGTPYDYESVKGISYYYNNISRSELPSITKFTPFSVNGALINNAEIN